jgi:hypothetical protein
MAWRDRSPLEVCPISSKFHTTKASPCEATKEVVGQASEGLIVAFPHLLIEVFKLR